jgi:hypothetical protein
MTTQLDGLDFAIFFSAQPVAEFVHA